MSREDDLNELVHYWIEMARESLDAASDEMAAERFAFSVNRIYYGCFYAVTAVMLKRGLIFKKHSGVRAAFHQHFVKPGLISREHGLLYDELFEARQRGDYIVLVSFEKAEVEEWLSRAREFIGTITSIL